MRKKIAVTAIIAIAAVVATLLVAQPILSQEDTASADITDDANINAILSEILAGQGEVSSALNGVDTGQAVSDAQALQVWISDDPYGASVTNVKASNPWTTGKEYTYWMNYDADKSNMQLDFIIIYVGNGKSPIQYDYMHWDFSKLYPGTGYGGRSAWPFAVSLWGGDPTIGPAYFIVLADGVYKGYYAFDVIK